MGNEMLSLQQKMVRIRSEIPALIKRAYSEDVAYDFTKIDDIFRYLTPAMNNWKVNLEIEFEQATKKDDQKNPVFVQYLNSCQMWLYEADLGLEWINAENPEDTYRVIIHAIGTHEVPEKAKGSAWTYALKYYLLDKYCIDQGGEDPDMRAGDVTEGTDYDYGDNQEACHVASDGYGDGQEGYDYGSQAEAECAVEMSLADENTSTEERQIGEEQEETGGEAGYNMGERTGEQPEAQPMVSSHIRPENGKKVTLPEGVKQGSGKETGMSVEEASNIVCTFGVYNKKKLGDLAQMGSEGMDALRWFAYDYRGRNETIKEGARLLLQVSEAA